MKVLIQCLQVLIGYHVTLQQDAQYDSLQCLLKPLFALSRAFIHFMFFETKLTFHRTISCQLRPYEMAGNVFKGKL